MSPGWFEIPFVGDESSPVGKKMAARTATTMRTATTPPKETPGLAALCCSICVVRAGESR
jgi:hypothetical protein